MIPQKTQQQLNKVFLELGQNLDITKSQFEAAVKCYTAVSTWLSQEGSSLVYFRPEILTQGSFLLGTMIKPINENDELDVDVVCRLEGKPPSWSQYSLKQRVGDRIKENEAYRKMLDAEGRRCWTIQYSDSSNFHLDILPSLVSSKYKEVLEKAFTTDHYDNFNELALRITDKYEEGYHTDVNSSNWPKSNPFGYARWFYGRSNLDLNKDFMLSEAVNPVPSYREEKLPLQRVVQLLKRHRDIMFQGDDDKPISIIITTLAAKAYKNETDISSALVNAINEMPNLIDEKYDSQSGESIKWIGNPVNLEENFADKWPETPRKERNFYAWLNKLKNDIVTPSELGDIIKIKESFSEAFGKNLTDPVFNKLIGSAMFTSSTSTLSAKVPKDVDVDLPKRVPKQKREGFAK